MLTILKNRIYRHLLAAQVIALIGTGLMTVALGLLAYDLAGADAGAVLGTALAIKMVAYVGIAPVAHAFASRLPRRSLLVVLELVRAAMALSLPRMLRRPTCFFSSMGKVVSKPTPSSVTSTQTWVGVS